MLRWIRLKIDLMWVSARYWIRPYDMLGDDRRWRWQKRGCARFQVTQEQIDALRKAIKEHPAVVLPWSDPEHDVMADLSEEVRRGRRLKGES